jgi:hypothetical protein
VDCPIFNVLLLNQHTQWHICASLGLALFCVLYTPVSVNLTLHRLAPPSRTQPTGADGNCLFRSISFVLTGSEGQFHVIRELVCNYIEKFYASLGVNQSYKAVSRMRDSGIWGTDVEILALSSLLRCNIFVYTNVGTRDGSARWIRFEPINTLPSPVVTDSVYSIFLNHLNGNHFEPVIAF